MDREAWRAARFNSGTQAPSQHGPAISAQGPLGCPGDSLQSTEASAACASADGASRFTPFYFVQPHLPPPVPVRSQAQSLAVHHPGLCREQPVEGASRRVTRSDQCLRRTGGPGGLPWGLSGRNPPAKAGDMGLIPGSGRSPGDGNGHPLQYSSWRIPWTEEPGGLQSMGSQRVEHDLAVKQQQQKGGGQSWRRHGTRAPRTESAESQPLDCQRSPSPIDG